MEFSDFLHPTRLFKKSITNQPELSTAEAYNLWDSLRVRYTSRETNQLYKNFVHDRDLELLLDHHIRKYNNQIKILEQLSEKFNVPVPSKPPKDIKFSAQIDAITDKHIFRRINSDMIAELYSLNRTIASSTFNDNLRNQFVNFVSSHLKDYNKLHKYAKLKGWTDVAPSLKTYKPTTKEELATSEGSHLSQLLALRYDQQQLTALFLGFVHDPDFKQIIKSGKSTLQKQIKTLEKKAQKFEVPLPDAAPAHQKLNIDPEAITDIFIYRTILQGIRESITLHIRSIIETITNDDLRTFLNQLYQEEVDIFNKLIKYGKTKGWSRLTLRHKQS
ncbi:DUF3231 family protein [Natroniella sulfidigena]|uniref:DUF3231 family protein n=1 Tax=Natroniella sulfidigena TaxID=723921 RepID=UPI00200B25FD|nr:DUF3231 family protein [Natroniella sulfidigena]MCK8818037.1 DUF3231 family protein [Natroniella sulfidigena]